MTPPRRPPPPRRHAPRPPPSSAPPRSSPPHVPLAIADINVARRLLHQLTLPDQRRQAMHLLSQVKVSIPNLPELLWNSSGIISALLEEITRAYRHLSPPALSLEESYHVVEAINLLQSVAAHPDTRIHFLNAQIPSYLYPFLNCRDQSPAIITLMLASLKVISELIKVDDTAVVLFLLYTEIVPLCLRAVDVGDEPIRMEATFILHRIVVNDVGLSYICSATAPDRMLALIRTTCRALMTPSQPSVRLLKNIILCYVRLADNSRACDALKIWLPILLRDLTFNVCAHTDQTNRPLLELLLQKVGIQNWYW